MDSVVVEHIFKTYRSGKESVTALSDVSFEVKEGELFGLIGPDGAGKTSLFRILTTVSAPDKGSARVEGFDVQKDFRQIRNIAGYMPGKFSLYMDLTIEENIQFFASIFRTSLKENYDLIKNIYVQLEPFKNRRAENLSGGMKQKLALCCALIHQPKVLFLDEPTTGVDPVSRKEFWDMLKSLRERNISILVSTPYMDEADKCDRIALIQGGKILKIDSPAGIISTFGKIIYAVKGENMYRLTLALRDYPNALSCFSFGEYCHLTLSREGEGEANIRSFILSKGFREDGLTIKKIEAGVEDVFISLMKEA